jgi:hypothetical protein
MQLVVSLVSTPPERRDAALHIPYAIEASDKELARLNVTKSISMDRPHWEPSALLYGSVHTRNY